jgi:hypothetical protein
VCGISTAAPDSRIERDLRVFERVCLWDTLLVVLGCVLQEAPACKWCDLSGAVVWRRFWRPAAARTGPCVVSGEPAVSAQGGVLKHIKMPKWRHMRAFSSSVSEWRGDAVTASGNRLVTASGYVTACGDAVTARGYRVRPTRITREPDVVTA